jgi:serine/threonine-protein kinase
MPTEKDAIFGKLAVERGYLTQEQLDEALAAQKAGAEATDVAMPLAQLMVGKGMLTRDQAQELVNAVAVETGEAHLVAGYEVIAKLGQGGMGAVYKAKHPTSGQFVALKILPPSLATDELVKRFQREAEIVRKLDHDNIVGCIEFGFDKQRKVHFCALELIEGQDLGKRIAELGKLTEKEAVSITSQIAQALQHACFNGLIHRDVKPENIMVTPDGTAKLLDLGLARPSSTEATRMTQSGLIVGSPYYISPEQAMAERDIDIRTDIYSLGATLYHMVTGKPPFEGGTALAILQKHVAEKLPWPADVNPELSDGFCRIVAKMMAKAPADRYRTPNELCIALGLLAEGEEPAVRESVLRRSSIMYGVRQRKPQARRRKPERQEPAKERGEKVAASPGLAERRRPDSARRRRRGAEPQPRGEASGWSALPTGAKIGIPAGAGVVAVVVLAVLLSGGGKPDRKPVKPGSERGRVARANGKSGGDALREKPGKVTPESVPPRAGRPAVGARKASSPVAITTLKDAPRRPVDTRKVSPPSAPVGGTRKAEPAPALSLDLGGVTMEFVYIKPGTFVMGGEVSNSKRLRPRNTQ